MKMEKSAGHDRKKDEMDSLTEEGFHPHEI